MRHRDRGLPFGILGVGLLFLATAGCGGSISGAGPTGDGGPPGALPDAGPNPDCPPPSHVYSTGSCSESGLTCPTYDTVADCSGSRQAQCFCDGESWTCEHGGSTAACPDASTTCPSPSTVLEGGSCDTPPSLVCDGSLAPVDQPAPGTCVGKTTSTCACSHGAWTCTVSSAPCYDPPPVCPNPAKVIPGGSCAGYSGGSCTSSNIVVENCSGTSTAVKGTCQCSGGVWSCPVGVTPPCVPPPPPPPPPTCPNPQYVRAYGACAYMGQDCPGDPQLCDGQVFYDAFECAGSWIPIATTTCNAYGYPAVDGGAAVDAAARF